MAKLNFTVDPDKCIQCDACVKDCITGIITRTDQVPAVLPEHEQFCLECQHCLAVCPTGAVSIFGLDPENSLALTPETLPTARQMHTLIRGRRSVRQFKQENVASESIDALLATLANSPTGCNDRDLHFLLLDGRATMASLLDRVVGALEERVRTDKPLPEYLRQAVAGYRENGVDIFFRNAPHLLIAYAGDRANCPKEDVDLALAYFELLAQCSGIGTTWCGFLKMITDAAPELRAYLGLGPETHFYAMLFGYPDVHYARTVQRDTAATVQRFTPAK